MGDQSGILLRVPGIDQRVLNAVQLSLPERPGLEVHATSCLREDLGLDSVGFMTLVVHLAAEFDFDVASRLDALLAVETVADLILAIRDDRRARGPE